jgi:glycerol-3-phosphate O-acyltransferase
MPYSPTVSTDDIARAVLERDDVADFVRGGQGVSPADRRQQIEGVLDELKTRQRYRFYRALQHPFYPILRKVERIGEHIDRAKDATKHGRVIYVSNHKSHLDYLIQPIVLDDNGVRPPLTVAGINLFGGALGFIHRHFTGAIPIRRNSKDPVYLFTLRAYIVEVLKRRDLLFYAEGGRSYTGELKPAKTGLLQAALLGDRHELSIVPMAIAYDLVLEERILAREALKKRKRPITQEVAEMVRHAVGYRSRAFVSFGHPIPLSGFEPGSRRDLVTLVQRVQEEIGKAYKVLPTALVAAALRLQMTRKELDERVTALIGAVADEGGNLAVRDGPAAAEEGVMRLAERGVIVEADGRVRVRDRLALRYYARTIQHLIRPRRTTH